MKRIINNRPLLFCAVALCVGICLGTLLLADLLWMIAVPIATLAIGMLLWGITNKRIFLFIFIFLMVGMVLFIGDYHYYQEEELSGFVQVTGRVEKYDATNGNVVLDNVTVDGKEYKNSFYFSMQNFRFKEGDLLSLSGFVSTNEFDWQDNYSLYRYSKNYRYRLKNCSGFVKNGTKKTLSQKIRAKCKEAMKLFMDDEETGFCLTLIFGDKSNLSDAVQENMRSSGLAHVFAVSGLHVSFLTAVLMFLCKKLEVPPLISWIICAVFLLLYGILTGFPAGVKRASITFLVLSLVPLLHGKPDGLTSLSLSVIAILLFDPRELFDISFIMSICAVLGIVFFYSQPYRFICTKVKSKSIRYFLGIVLTTISANIFIFPISCMYFGGIQLYSIITNVLILPVVTVLFVCVAVTVFLTLIYKGFGSFYLPIAYVIEGINRITAFFADLPYATVEIKLLVLPVFLYYLCWIVVSRFLLISKKLKIIFGSSLAVATILCVVFL